MEDLVFVGMSKLIDETYGCVYFNREKEMVMVRLGLLYLISRENNVKIYSHFTSHAEGVCRSFVDESKDVSLMINTIDLYNVGMPIGTTMHDTDDSNSSDENDDSDEEIDLEQGKDIVGALPQMFSFVKQVTNQMSKQMTYTVCILKKPRIINMIHYIKGENIVNAIDVLSETHLTECHVLENTQKLYSDEKISACIKMLENIREEIKTL